MGKSKSITDEEIVAAIISNGSIGTAAASLNISERSIYYRMNDGDFQALYKNARADILRQAVCNINEKISDAINTINEVMTNQETNAAVRLQAAQTILNTAIKFTDRLSINEQSVINQLESNDYLL